MKPALVRVQRQTDAVETLIAYQWRGSGEESRELSLYKVWRDYENETRIRIITRERKGDEDEMRRREEKRCDEMR